VVRGQNVTLTVETSEGYEAVYTTSKLPGVVLSIEDVKFDYTNTTYFDMQIERSGTFEGSITLDRINVSLSTGLITSSDISIPIAVNQTIPYRYRWDWNTYRNKTLIVGVHTVQGFTAVKTDKTTITPPEVVWNITDIIFDLDDVERFLLNVTNAQVSLQNLTLTSVRIVNGTKTITVNQTAPSLPHILEIGTSETLNCTLNWKNLGLRGRNVTIIVLTQVGLNLSRTFTIPSVKMQILEDNFVYGDLRDQYPNVTIPLAIPYFNITVSNSDNSLANVTITRITIAIGNVTYEIDYNLTNPILGSRGYVLRTGETVTIMCSWDWTRYSGSNSLEVVVYTKEGFQTSKTWTAMFP
jgi:hypothetical protein